MIEVFGFVNVWMLFMLFIFVWVVFLNFLLLVITVFFVIYTDDQKNMPVTPFYY